MIKHPNGHFGIAMLIGGQLVYGDIALAADNLRNCVDIKTSQYEQRQQFTSKGSVTCRPATIVGFPPNVRKYNASGTVRFDAPEGFKIVNDSINSIKISVTSSSDGTNEPAQIADDGASVLVPISCRGAGLAQGKSWHEIVVSGTIRKVPSNDQIIQWTVDCARELTARPGR